ncbi:gamma-glutamylcyclotransferase [Tabrizicola sp.]|uniref:gamma-glutamylcyclotransferase n=1 Tax=Tabrizicola sp. TaxID=2005166 RepID=UPI0027330755|nr:gamma-glutamylcyclotransferase [Tabrizicola sp.]MDP3195587.1 gamma-glutamylcyclotransferase [Tabrizicola sp.]
MPRSTEPLSLTPDHIARVHRVVADAGPAVGVEQQTDADYAGWVERILDAHPCPDRPIQLFAYGSLIWKPEMEHRAERPAVARGYHRAFCLRIHRFRGTVDEPGLMMALDRGGQCRGVIYELPPDDPALILDRLFRREFTVKPINSMPRWLTVETADGPLRALGFVMNRDSPYYAGRLPPEAVARTLSRACGHWGSGAEYLLNTVTQLDARGIRDAGLWRLQGLVAEEIDRNAPRPLP